MKQYVALYCSHILFLIVCVQSDETEVICSFGRLNGLRVNVGNGKIVYQFRKIPFAIPPVGSLRFQKPIAHPPLSGLYDATKFGPACIQTLAEEYKSLLPNNSANTSEDCLHLNIYVPNDIVSTPRAVMLWIHGGGFTIGESMSYDGTLLASSGNVIVVTTNYRLGLFGFMSTEDSSYPGNYGLFDQLEAIKWVKRHIRSFGGDPNRITIFGESAGAFSVVFLATSPLSKGLFQRAIMESGGDLHSYAVQRNLRNISLQSMQLLGCLNNTNISFDTRKCMMDADAYQIVNASNNVNENIQQIVPGHKMSIGPTIDGELIRGIPEKLLQVPSSIEKEIFYSLDIMAGINSADGGDYIFFLSAVEKQYNFTIEDGISVDFFCNVLVPLLVRDYYSSNDLVARKMCGQYTSLDGKVGQARSTLDWYRDFIFTYPMRHLLDLHMRSSKGTYQYLFSKQPTNTEFSLSMPNWFKGANHGDELPFVFGDVLVNKYSTQPEKILSETIMRYWTNFAKTGNPNIGDGNDPTWLPYNYRRAYIDLDDRIAGRHNLYIHRTDFWMSIQRMIVK